MDLGPTTKFFKKKKKKYRFSDSVTGSKRRKSKRRSRSSSSNSGSTSQEVHCSDEYEQILSETSSDSEDDESEKMTIKDSDESDVVSETDLGSDDTESFDERYFKTDKYKPRPTKSRQSATADKNRKIKGGKGGKKGVKSGVLGKDRKEVSSDEHEDGEMYREEKGNDADSVTEENAKKSSRNKGNFTKSVTDLERGIAVFPHSIKDCRIDEKVVWHCAPLNM